MRARVDKTMKKLQFILWRRSEQRVSGFLRTLQRLSIEISTTTRLRSWTLPCLRTITVETCFFVKQTCVNFSSWCVKQRSFNKCFIQAYSMKRMRLRGVEAWVEAFVSMYWALYYMQKKAELTRVWYAISDFFADPMRFSKKLLKSVGLTSLYRRLLPHVFMTLVHSTFSVE